jgi:O-methyltransferase
MNNDVLRYLHGILQRFILLVPWVSDICSAGDKVLAFSRAWQYLEIAKVRGDYLEFGVFRGTSFDLSLRSAAKFVRKGTENAPRFFAFDSFEGLPEPDPERDGDVFSKGEYSNTVDTFRKNTRRASRGWDVRIVPGFFDESLSDETIAEHDLVAAAFVNIDCDIYSSTLTALEFVTPLVRTGTVIFFDDWYASGGNMKLGEPGACEDWLEKNPDIELIDFGQIAIMGKLFIVNRDEREPPGNTESEER